MRYLRVPISAFSDSISLRYFSYWSASGGAIFSLKLDRDSGLPESAILARDEGRESFSPTGGNACAGCDARKDAICTAVRVVIHLPLLLSRTVPSSAETLVAWAVRRCFAGISKTPRPFSGDCHRQAAVSDSALRRWRRRLCCCRLC